VLIHLLDGAAADPLADWAMINQELALYSARLEQRPQIVVLNKLDLAEARAREPQVKARMAAEGVPFCAISAATGEGVRHMLYRVWEMVQAAPAPDIVQEQALTIRPAPDEEAFTITREEDGWRVHGRRIERIAAMTYFEFEATARRFQQILERMGISQALEEAGVQPGDTVHIGREALEWGE
jgi:GTP-binding protein